MKGLLVVKGKPRWVLFLQRLNLFSELLSAKLQVRGHTGEWDTFLLCRNGASGNEKAAGRAHDRDTWHRLVNIGLIDADLATEGNLMLINSPLGKCVYSVVNSS